MKRQIRLGIWGCKHGMIGHGNVVHMIPGAIFAGIHDHFPEVMRDACKTLKNKVTCFTTPEDMLCNIDAVIIATEDKDHIDNMELALSYNLHVLIEKPVAITLEQMTAFKKLLEVAKAKGLVVTSCHPRRFDQPFVWLKDNISGLIQRYGEVVGFHYDFTYHEPTANWKALSRSLLLDHHGHEIDLVNFLFGHNFFEEELHDDSAERYLVTGRRHDGIKFSFHGTRRMKEEVYHEWMTVRFEKGSVTVNTSTGEVIYKDMHANTVEVAACPATDYTVRSLGVTGNFIGAILNEQENYLTEEELILNNSSGIKLLRAGYFSYEP